MTLDIILPPNSKAIPLTRGKYAIVDEADYEYLMKWKWHYCNGYAVRQQHIAMVSGKQAQIGINGKRIYVGSFASEKEAAHAYNETAVSLQGEYVCMNDVA